MERGIDRKPCGTTATFNSPGSADIAVFAIGLPPRPGITRGLPGPIARASSRTSRARRHSGIRCLRFPFVRGTGMVGPDRMATTERAGDSGFLTGGGTCGP